MAKAKQPKKKFDWDTFLNRKVLQVIHCETAHELLALKTELAKRGLKWRSGDSYTNKNICQFCEYENKTALTNGGQYCDVDYFNRSGTVIYRFSMYDFGD